MIKFLDNWKIVIVFTLVLCYGWLYVRSLESRIEYLEYELMDMIENAGLIKV